MSMSPLVDLLHILTCTRIHEDNITKILDRDPKICYYYLENDMANGHEMDDHVAWIQNAEVFKAVMGFTLDTEAIDFIKACIQNAQTARELCIGNSDRLAFYTTLFKQVVK